MNSVYSPMGDSGRKKSFMYISGVTSSVWENRVLENLLGIPAVSAVRLLKIASEQGIEVLSLTSDNIGEKESQLQLDSQVLIAIRNALNSGKHVITSQSQVDYYDWSGVGYIIVDPSTGDAAYMISGGLAGSGTVKILTDPPTVLDKYYFKYWQWKQIFNASVIANARSMVGTDWVMGSKDPAIALDCSGFTKYIVSLSGFKIPDGASGQYGYFESNGMLWPDPEPANLFFYRSPKTNKINHVGFVVSIVEDASGPVLIRAVDSLETDEHNVLQKMVIEHSFDKNNASEWTYWNNCLHRPMPPTHSDACRPPVPEHAAH